MKSRKLEFKTAELVTLLLAICIFSTLTGCLVGYKLLSITDDSSQYTEVDAELQNFINEYNEIKESFEGDFDSKLILTNAIAAVVATLDEYSGIVDLESTTSDSIKLKGIYTGVGIEIFNDSNYNIIINNVFKDTPAYKAGIKPGDKIIKFNEMDVVGFTSSQLSSKIKDTNGKNFTLELLRGEDAFTVTLKSENIVLNSVSTEVYSVDTKNIGYIKIDLFANNTALQLDEALKNFEKNDIKGLILDLRDNPGGYLHTAYEMSSSMLDSNKIVYKTNDNGKVDAYYSTGNKNYDKKIVILINNNSASASELFTAALKENLGAIVVGETSFGKGTVQEVKEFNGTQYKYTTKLWMTPNGNSINKVGIVPDIEIKLNVENDNQLQKAMEQFK